MTQRRTLSTAMDVTPEKFAFIKGTEPSASQFNSQATTEESSSAVSKQPATTVPSRAAAKERERPRLDDTSLVGDLLVPLTTRLQPKTADALRRAYLEQKLNRRRPDTQQEIVEAALQGWLRKEGFL